MTFNTLETSVYDAQPVELYEFALGDSLQWLYTTAEYPIEVQNGALKKTYTPEQIKSSSVQNTQELNKLVNNVRVPHTNPVATLFQTYPPTEVLTCKIFRRHREDSEATVSWMGRVLSVDFSGPEAELHCEPITTSIRRLGLRRHYQRQCPHVLYGPDCKVSRDAYTITTSVKAHEGLVVSINTTLTHNQLAGGMMSWSTPVGTAWRAITGNDEHTINLNFPVMSDDNSGRALPVGTHINLYPGCQHTLTDCVNKFKNRANYGGFPFSPFSNPFNLSTLW